MTQQWKLTLFVLFFLPLLLRLGFWQLERAEEKRQLWIVYQEQKRLPAVPLDIDQKQTVTHYQTVIVEGHYDRQRYWLLDNQPRNGQVGYEVIMPLQVGKQWLLVNRGWVAAPARRDQLPVLKTPEGKVTLQGYLHQPSQNAVLKQLESDLLVDWPKRVLQINHFAAQSVLKADVYPTQLRIKDDSPGALITQWPVMSTQPEKHQGYAVQWFTMALVLFLLYGWVLLFRTESKTLENNREK
ncbi:hypothetical protein AB835_05690 [Candidatus Endobugula sertula]|uniref:SURF1-like protein n=1 Tax=Candidatus Endobugula sertula TaxID=62101 RepID=A0A1D2QR17_9GAMM|nr:hypothetical protein AB835_05690 [Candidatus Endobugula sertula]